jgi:splicing factor 1
MPLAIFLCCCSARDKMLDKRNRLIEEVLKLDPEFKPPADYKPRKFTNKIYIPINEYPGYNFIGAAQVLV